MANRDVTNAETVLMNVHEFVMDLRRRGMKVWAEAEHVVVEPDALTEADTAAIVTNKPAILAHLRAEVAPSAQPPTVHESKHYQHVNGDAETDFPNWPAQSLRCYAPFPAHSCWESPPTPARANPGLNSMARNNRARRINYQRTHSDHTNNYRINKYRWCSKVNQQSPRRSSPMAMDDRSFPDSAIMFVNDRRSGEKDPHFKGHGELNCPACRHRIEFWLSAWRKIGKKSGEFLSLSLRAKDDAQARTRSAQRNDDIEAAPPPRRSERTI